MHSRQGHVRPLSSRVQRKNKMKGKQKRMRKLKIWIVETLNQKKNEKKGMRKRR
jgi:hypothetical protein